MQRCVGGILVRRDRRRAEAKEREKRRQDELRERAIERKKARPVLRFRMASRLQARARGIRKASASRSSSARAPRTSSRRSSRRPTIERLPARVLAWEPPGGFAPQQPRPESALLFLRVRQLGGDVWFEGYDPKTCDMLYGCVEIDDMAVILSRSPELANRKYAKSQLMLKFLLPRLRVAARSRGATGHREVGWFGAPRTVASEVGVSVSARQPLGSGLRDARCPQRNYRASARRTTLRTVRVPLPPAPLRRRRRRRRRVAAGRRRALRCRRER